jgi:hypothetical protein
MHTYNAPDDFSCLNLNFMFHNVIHILAISSSCITHFFIYNLIIFVIFIDFSPCRLIIMVLLLDYLLNLLTYQLTLNWGLSQSLKFKGGFKQICLQFRPSALCDNHLAKLPHILIHILILLDILAALENKSCELMTK